MKWQLFVAPPPPPRVMELAPGVPAPPRGGGGTAAPSAPPLRVTLLTAGSSGVGKTSLVRRFCEGRFPSRAAPTIGVDFGVHPVAATAAAPRGVRVNFFDLSGAGAYRDVRTEFWRDAQGVLLVYDAGERASFEALGAWLDEGARHGLPRGVPVVVCGAKAPGAGPGAVTLEDARAWARAHGGGAVVACCEANASSGEGVSDAFEQLLAHALAATAAAAAGGGASGGRASAAAAASCEPTVRAR